MGLIIMKKGSIAQLPDAFLPDRVELGRVSVAT